MSLPPIPNPRPISDEIFNLLISKIDQVYTLSNLLKFKLRPVLMEVTYKKGCHILHAGAGQPVAWFLIDGLLQETTVDKRNYSSNTSWFWFGFAFVYASPGFFDRKPAQVTIHVVKDSTVVLFSYVHWKILKELLPETEILTENLRTDYESSRKLHLLDINKLSTVARYLKSEPKINHLFQYVQLRHISEYMGMSTDTLGKLRRRFSKERRGRTN